MLCLPADDNFLSTLLGRLIEKNMGFRFFNGALNGKR